VSDNSNLSFDRMRSMLMRAAEIRDSEQQQIFDSLDEIHARLAALDALGTVRKRLADLPDRTEVSVLAERLDETVAKLDGQDDAIGALARSVEATTDRLAKPFAQLDGRLEGVGGRMEGIAGRMDGLDDRFAGLHKRLDDVDNRLDRNELRLDGIPAALAGSTKERVDGLEHAVRDQVDGVRALLGETGAGLHGKLEELAARPAVDPSERFDSLAGRLDELTSRLDDVTARIASIEDGVLAKVDTLATAVEQGLGRLESSLGSRPDRGTIESLVKQANQESERRSAGQLDEAMATFAELILGRGAPVAPPMPPPRPAQRRGRSKAAVKANNGVTRDEDDGPESDDN
jgi:chromosome segregation ATPase